MIVHVESLPDLWPHLLHHVPAVLVEDVHERLEDIDVERRRDHFAMGPPFLACGRHGLGAFSLFCVS